MKGAVLLLGAASALKVEKPANPVTRVVSMLRDMLTASAADSKKDEAVNSKWACHCKSEHENAVALIDEATINLDKFDSSIEGAIAAKEANQQKIDDLDAQMNEKNAQKQENEDARKKQREDFNLEHADTQQNIQQLKSALEVLSNRFSEGATEANTQKALGLDREMQAGLLSTLSTVKSPKMAELETALKAKGSGQMVYGMVKQLLSDMEAGFEEARSEYEHAEEIHQGIITNFSKMVQGMKGSRLIAFEAFEDAAATVGEDEPKYAAAKSQLATNQERKQNLEIDCQRVKEEYDARVTLREEEDNALAKAINALSADDATKAFQAGFDQPNFLQLSAKESMQRGLRARQALLKVHSQKVVPVIAAIQTGDQDYFVAARETLNRLIEDIEHTMQNDVEGKKSCQGNINNYDQENMLAGKAVQHAEAALAATHAELDTTNTQFAEDQKSIKNAKGAEDEANNLWKLSADGFHHGVTDLVTSRKLLSSALQTLTEFYKKPLSPGESFIQEDPVGSPAGFEAEGTQEKGAETVLALIQHIIDDAQGEIDNYVQEYNDAQGTYSDDITSTQQNLKEALARKSDSQKRLGELGEQLGDNNEEVNTAEAAKASAADTLAAEKDRCEFLMQYFDHRQETQLNEIDSYKDALSYLAGMQ